MAMTYITCVIQLILFRVKYTPHIGCFTEIKEPNTPITLKSNTLFQDYKKLNSTVLALHNQKNSLDNRERENLLKYRPIRRNANFSDWFCPNKDNHSHYLFDFIWYIYITLHNIVSFSKQTKNEECIMWRLKIWS